MPDRRALREAFLSRTPWAEAAQEPLPADASFRRYIRLRRNGETALLMDAPPETENTRAYVAIARYLAGAGLSAPDILHADEDRGFAVIEDFGSDTWAALLDQGEDAAELYGLAVDVLAHLHGRATPGTIDLPPYDRDALMREAVLLPDWYLSTLRGAATPADVRAEYIRAWDDVIAALPPYAPVPVLRDYHVDNLMLLPDRAGVARCGLLDFQDALLGHPTYDLMSLLEDARRDVPDDLAQGMRSRYSAALPGSDSAAFDDWYDVLAAQRHAKVAGIFVRLCVRDKKPVYLPHLPRVMRLLARRLSSPVLAPVRAWFDAYLPDPEQPLAAFDAEAIRKLIIG